MTRSFVVSKEMDGEAEAQKLATQTVLKKYVDSPGRYGVYSHTKDSKV